jgi:septum site-determining protein MinC
LQSKQKKLPLAKTAVLLYYFNNIICCIVPHWACGPFAHLIGMSTDVTQPAISIKGIRDGLLLSVDGHNSLTDLVAELEQVVVARHAFLQGSRIALAVGMRPFTADHLQAVHAILSNHDLELWAVLAEREETRQAARKLGLATRLPGSQTDLEGNMLVVETAASSTSLATADQPAVGDLFLRETLRSGRSIFHEGAVTILGDVNPGAEVIAGGSVIVWGRLRGLVHAGAMVHPGGMGDKTAVICALDLNPTQLRIADQIAVSPTGARRKPQPEQAAIRQGQIVAEPWHK